MDRARGPRRDRGRRIRRRLPAAAWRRRPAGPDRGDAAQDYLAAWQDQKWPRLQSLVAGAPAVAPVTYKAQLDGLGADQVRTRLLSGKGNARNWSGRFEARLRVPRVGTITYPGDLNLTRRQGKWKVVWTAATVHPKLPEDGSFAVERAFPPRAPILAVDSTPLTVDTTVVDVGLVPERIKDRAGAGSRTATDARHRAERRRGEAQRARRPAQLLRADRDGPRVALRRGGRRDLPAPRHRVPAAPEPRGRDRRSSART